MLLVVDTYAGGTGPLYRIAPCPRYDGLPEGDAAVVDGQVAVDQCNEPRRLDDGDHTGQEDAVHEDSTGARDVPGFGFHAGPVRDLDADVHHRAVEPGGHRRPGRPGGAG